MACPPAATTLSVQEVDDYCRQLLSPITSQLTRSVLGQRGADNAGTALHAALLLYKRPSPMSVEAFVRAKVANIVRDIIRSEDGRHGSAKGDAHAATVSMQSSSIKDLDVTCSTDPEEVAVNNDQIAFFVAGIDRAPLFPRIVLGLRVFGGLNDALIRNILSASQDTINNALPEIRESLRAA